MVDRSHTTTIPPLLDGGNSMAEGGASQVEQAHHVGLALIDALALWCAPVQDALEMHKIVPYHDNLSKEDVMQPHDAKKISLQKEFNDTKEGQKTQTTLQKQSPSSTQPLLSPLEQFRTLVSQKKILTSSDQSQQQKSLTRGSHNSTSLKTPFPLSAENNTSLSLRSHINVPSSFSQKKTNDLKNNAAHSKRQQDQNISHSKSYIHQPCSPIPKEIKRERSNDEESQHQGGEEVSQSDCISLSATCKKTTAVALSKLHPPVSNHVAPIAQVYCHVVTPAISLSNALGISVSHFDILLICLQLMKLEINSQEEDINSRRKERELQLQYLKKEIATLQQQAKMQVFAHAGAGALGVISGLSPILGHLKGDAILSSLSRLSFFSNLQQANKIEFFKGVSAMTQALSETQRSIAQIHGSYADSDRTHANRFSDVHKTEHDELTRHMEQLQERLRQMERFLTELLQMRHDVASQLYR